MENYYCKFCGYKSSSVRSLSPQRIALDIQMVSTKGNTAPRCEFCNAYEMNNNNHFISIKNLKKPLASKLCHGHTSLV